MKYISYLKNKNLSNNTIKVYMRESENWIKYLNGNKPNKRFFVKYLKSFYLNHSPNSIRLIYSAILSYMRYLKQWKLINEFKDIKLPSIQRIHKTTICINEYKNVNESIVLDKWIDKRDWLLFNILFFTGIRVSELFKLQKNNIANNKINIVGKGNKTRTIFIPNNLSLLINTWNANKFPISKNNKLLTYKQVNIIIKKIGIEYFNKSITPHSLRRSYATNLLRNNIDLKTVSTLLGHSNINTTSQYIYYTQDEIVEKIKNVFNN